MTSVDARAIAKAAGLSDEDIAYYQALAGLSEDEQHQLIADPAAKKRFETWARYTYRLHAYGTSPINSARRTKQDVEALRAWLYCLLYDRHPMTVRQVFYQALPTGLIVKTEREYKGTICRLLTQMRKKGEIPYRWIADNTRWMRKPKTHSSMQVMLEETAKFYRRALWQEQEAYVEVWLEKDALSGVLWEVTSRYDVPLMVTRGYPSFSFLAGAAEAIEAQGKPAYLYYLGFRQHPHRNIRQRIVRIISWAVRDR
jgi:hypothetical protein